jgi:phosphatidylglycerol:prolipoprotein diacylglycerol transferase
VILVVAFLTAMWLAYRTAKRLPPGQRVLTPAQIVDVFSLAMLSGVLGARLFFVVQYWEVFVRQPLEIPAIWHGGLVWYGGFLGGLAGIIGYLRFHHIPVLRGIDQFIPFVALGHGIGRIGCFLNGCCYGKPTSAWFGVTFAQGEPSRIPTQLLESAALLGLFLVLRRLQERRAAAPVGWLFGVYLLGYAVVRFIIEFLRGDQAVVWAGLTLQQLLSAGVFLAGLMLCRRVQGMKAE